MFPMGTRWRPAFSSTSVLLLEWTSLPRALRDQNVVLVSVADRVKGGEKMYRAGGRPDCPVWAEEPVPADSGAVHAV